ncbi:MAG: bifunctional ornithine acetyltransferase/N-acetylglutamate synthase [Clostridium fessum]
MTVDGDTSTNDMCTVLANGMAGNAEITAEGPAYDAFCEALQAVMQDLAREDCGRRRGRQQADDLYA